MGGMWELRSTEKVVDCCQVIFDTRRQAVQYQASTPTTLHNSSSSTPRITQQLTSSAPPPRFASRILILKLACFSTLNTLCTPQQPTPHLQHKAASLLLYVQGLYEGDGLP